LNVGLAEPLSRFRIGSIVRIDPPPDQLVLVISHIARLSPTAVFPGTQTMQKIGRAIEMRFEDIKVAGRGHHGVRKGQVRSFNTHAEQPTVRRR